MPKYSRITPARSYSREQIIAELGLTAEQFYALPEKKRDKLTAMAIKDLDRKAKARKVKK